MSTADLEKLAATLSEMPSELDAAEQLLFLSLRQLYVIFRTGKLSRDIAKIEKNKIYKEYEVNKLNLSCWEQARQREQKLSVISQQIYASGCSVCRNYMRVIAGLKEDECNDKGNVPDGASEVHT